MTVIQEGRKAPDSTLEAAGVGPVRPRDLRGRAVVLSLDPKDGDASGTVRGVFPGVRVEGHAEKVLEALRAL